MTHDGGLARQGLQSQTREQSTYPEPWCGRAQTGREPWVPVPWLSDAEGDEGISVVLGRDGTGRGCHHRWERSQVGTIKYHVKRFSRLIVISFLLIIPPQIAGYSTAACHPGSSQASLAPRHTEHAAQIHLFGRLLVHQALQSINHFNHSSVCKIT